MLNPPAVASGRRGSVAASAVSDRSSAPQSHGHSGGDSKAAAAAAAKNDKGAADKAAGGGGSPGGAGHLPGGGRKKKATVHATTGFPLDAEEAQDSVKIIGPLADSPRISAMGSLRAVANGVGIQIVETKGANMETCEVTAASRDTYKGIGHSKFLLCVAFNPAGDLVASASGDAIVILWDCKTQARRAALIGHSSGVRSVAFSHDGLFLASGSSDHSVILWDTMRGNQRAQLKQGGHTAECNSVCFSSDSSFLFSAGVDRQIVVWDLRQPVVQLLTKLNGHLNHITALAASPDGRFMLSTGTDRQVIVWSTRSENNQPEFKQVDVLTKHTRDVHCVAFSVDGQYFATGGSDSLCVVWNAATFSEHVTLRGHTNRVMSVAWSPDGQLLATASMDKSIGLWNPVRGGGMKGQLKEHNHQVYSVAFPRVMPSGGGLAPLISGSFAANFIHWDFVFGKVTATLTGGHKANVRTVEWVQLREALHRLLVRSTDLDEEQVLWDAESGRTTMLDRVLEQEKKLREMDDMRIHQEKMIKLTKQRERQSEMDKRGVPEDDAERTAADGDLLYGDQHHSGLAPKQLELLMKELPDKIASAMEHNSSGARKRLLSAVAGGGGGAFGTGSGLDVVAGQHNTTKHAAGLHDGGSRHDGADDRSQVSYGDHGHGHEVGFNRGFSFGGGGVLGAGTRHDHGGVGGVGGSSGDGGATEHLLHQILETQRAHGAELAALQADVRAMTAMMADMLKLLSKK